MGWLIYHRETTWTVQKISIIRKYDFLGLEKDNIFYDFDFPFEYLCLYSIYSFAFRFRLPVFTTSYFGFRFEYRYVLDWFWISVSNTYIDFFFKLDVPKSNKLIFQRKCSSGRARWITLCSMILLEVLHEHGNNALLSI